MLDEHLERLRDDIERCQRDAGHDQSTITIVSKYGIQGQLETAHFWDDRFPKTDSDELGHPMRTNVIRQRLGTNTVYDDHGLWWAIVNEYTMRNLTKDFDKLPAIRGLAVTIYEKYLKAQTDVRYLMGLWTHKMASGLLWYVDHGAERTRPAVFRAPTWSWASVDGVISNDSLNMDEEQADVEICGFEGNSKTASSHTWLQDQCAGDYAVIVRGRLAAARWSSATADSDKRYYVARSLIHHESADLENASSLEDLYSPVSKTPEVGPLCHGLYDAKTKQRVGWMIPDSPDLPKESKGRDKGEELFCLKIQIRPREIDRPRKGNDLQRIPSIRGLVLVRSPSLPTTAEDICYRRVGYFELDCVFKGTNIGSEYSHHEDIYMEFGQRSRVARNREFLIANEPDLDPYSLFANVEKKIVKLV